MRTETPGPERERADDCGGSDGSDGDGGDCPGVVGKVDGVQVCAVAASCESRCSGADALRVT
eukprot:8980308-Alexandrium_andersonii.AAC.1